MSFMPFGFLTSGDDTPPPVELWTPAFFPATSWYDAADEDTIVLGAGTDIIEWHSKSPPNIDNFHDQGNLSTRPDYTGTLNGLNVVKSINGVLDSDVADYLDIGSPSGVGTNHVVLYRYHDEVSRSARVLDGRGGAGSTWIMAPFSGFHRIFDGGFLIGPSVIGLSTVISSLKKQPDNNSYLRVNGLESGDSPRVASQFPKFWTIGYSICYSDIAEVVTWLGGDDTYTEVVEGYLAHKWGIEDLLESGHPYKTAAPTTADVPVPTLWGPGEISLSSWYDASDASTITLSGSDVTEWASKSGSGDTLTPVDDEPIYVTDSLNGLNTVNFTLADAEMLSTDGASSDTGSVVGEASTFVIVFRRNTTLNTGTGYALFGSGGGFWYMGQNATNAIIDNGATIQGEDTSQVYTIMSLVKGTDDASEMFQDGVSEGTNTATNFTTYYDIGRPGNGCQCEIAEIVSFKTDSTDSRQRVEGYMAHKWGMAVKLASSHPYRELAPTV